MSQPVKLKEGDSVYHKEHGLGKVIQILKGQRFPYLVQFRPMFQEQFRRGELQKRSK